MGEIADMMLEGLLDEETGEYIGEMNLTRYGIKSPGFPVSYERESRGGESKSTICKLCGKRLKTRAGMLQHLWDKHGIRQGGPPDD